MSESLWDDRLAEVWASPGFAGAGVVVGTTGVLTARHVVAEAIAAPEGRVLARVVRPGLATGEWVPMRPAWEAAEWDVALLVVGTAPEDAQMWQAPASPAVVVAALGASAEPGCEAVGFPESAVQMGGGEPSERVRGWSRWSALSCPPGRGSLR